VDHQEGKEVVDGRMRYRTLRRRLSLLVGREPRDFADAKAEAQRAIVAWRDGRDATGLIPGDAPTLATLLEKYSERPGAPLAIRRQLSERLSAVASLASGRQTRSRAT